MRSFFDEIIISHRALMLVGHFVYGGQKGKQVFIQLNRKIFDKNQIVHQSTIYTYKILFVQKSNSMAKGQASPLKLTKQP